MGRGSVGNWSIYRTCGLVSFCISVLHTPSFEAISPSAWTMKGPITEQPSCYPVDVMDPNKDHSKDNLLATESGLCQNRRHARQRCCNGGAHEHNNCHKFRRRVLFPIFGVLLLLGVLLAGFCAYHSSTSGGISSFWNNTLENLGGFVKRAPGDPQNDNGVFIDRKCM